MGGLMKRISRKDRLEAVILILECFERLLDSLEREYPQNYIICRKHDAKNALVDLKKIVKDL